MGREGVVFGREQGSLDDSGHLIGSTASRWV